MSKNFTKKACTKDKNSFFVTNNICCIKNNNKIVKCCNK